MRLALFDLDHTLLSGDSDLLWCEFLMREQLLDPARAGQVRELAAAYTEGSVTPVDYCNFHAGTWAGRREADWEPMRQRFLTEIVRPLVPADARVLLQRHRDAGDTLLLTTATNRLVSGLTAADLGVDHHLATELETDADGRLTGRIQGAPNMRTGKVERLRSWLQQHLLPEGLLKQATFYTDSINDLALLSVVRHPVVVDPDPRLEATARRKGWQVVRFRR